MFNKFQITELLLYMCTNHSSNKLKTGIKKIPIECSNIWILNSTQAFHISIGQRRNHKLENIWNWILVEMQYIKIFVMCQSLEGRLWLSNAYIRK